MSSSALIIDGAFIPSKGELLGCVADKSLLQLHRVSHENEGCPCSVDVQLPSTCTAVCCGESGIVIGGTENGDLFMIPPEGTAPQMQQLYQHPSKNKPVHRVAISKDDDTVIATIGLEVVMISRVLLSSVLPVASATCILIPENKHRDYTRFSSIDIYGDTILLCECSGRGGITVIQGGKYRCRLEGSHEKDRMSARAFQFHGCGVVQSNNDGGMIVAGVENWGGLCLWNVPSDLKHGASVVVTKEFDVPMRSTIATAFSIHHDTGSDRVSFAIAYEGASLVQKAREKFQRDDPGWISVVTVPIQSLRVSKNARCREYVRTEGDIIVFDMQAMEEDRRLEEREQTDLDAFPDRKDVSRCHVSFLRFSSDGSLVTGTLGLPLNKMQSDASVKHRPCIRMFEKDRNENAKEGFSSPEHYSLSLQAAPPAVAY
jgi:hypothetical protein